MKFKIEVELNWIDEDYNLDESVKNLLINNLTAKVEKALTENISEKIAKRAESIVNAKTENLINTMLERPITINKGWNNIIEYESIYEMVEEQMSKLYDSKVKQKGNVCENDPFLSKVENYTKQQVEKLIVVLDKKIQLHSSAEAKKALQDSKLINALEDLLK